MDIKDAEKLRDWIIEYNDEAMLADGFEDAIIGMCERIGEEPVVAYDRDKCIEILMGMIEESDDDEDVREMAEEYFGYNVIGSYVGEGTPVFISKIPDYIYTEI